MIRVFITILLLAGASLLTIFYIHSKWTEFNLVRAEVENLSNISAELDELIAKRDSLLRTINTISKDDLNRIDRALPEGPRGADFLVILENITLRHNLALKRIEVSTLSNESTQNITLTGGSGVPTTATSLALSPKVKGTIKEFPVTLTVAGTYESFKDYLRDIEHLLRITNVSEISFGAAEKKSSFEFSIHGITYYQ